MHVSGSQPATNSEMLRFSYAAVPLGYVPSTGRALTGKLVAAAGHHLGGHAADELRRAVGNDAGSSRVAVTFPGHLDPVQPSRARSTAA